MRETFLKLTLWQLSDLEKRYGKAFKVKYIKPSHVRDGGDLHFANSRYRFQHTKPRTGEGHDQNVLRFSRILSSPITVAM